MEDEDRFDFDNDVDVIGAFTANSVASDLTVSGTTITASTGFALGDGDYIGVTSNEVITFATSGIVAVEAANFVVGASGTPDELEPYFAIRADADSDGDDTLDEFKIFLTATADPTDATWGFTTTQSAGYTFDQTVSHGVSGTPNSFSTSGDKNIAVYSKYTGDSGVFWGIYSEVNYEPASTTGAGASIYGLRGKVILDANSDLDLGENMTGVHGYACIESGAEVNHSSAVIAGLRGEVNEDGTYTSTRWVCAVEASLKLDVDVSSGYYTNVMAYSNDATYKSGAALTTVGYFDDLIDFSGLYAGTDYTFRFPSTSGRGWVNTGHKSSADGMIPVIVGTDTRWIRLWDD